MLNVLCTAFLLSALLFLLSLPVFALRKYLRNSGGSLLSGLWFIVLILSVVPLRVGTPSTHIIVEKDPITTDDASYPEPAPFFYWEEQPHTSAYAAPVSKPFDAYKPQQTLHIRLQDHGWIIVPAAAILSVLWICGTFIRLWHDLAEYRHLVKMLDANSSPCTDEQILDRFQTCKSCVRIRQTIQLRFLNEHLPVSPCVCGWLRPTLYLSAACRSLPPSDVSYVFLHELCHIKRHDILYKLFVMLVSAVHWWNPMMKHIRRAAAEDLEMACDAAVLRITGADACRDYMKAVLSVAEQLYTGSASPLPAMAEHNEPQFLKRRYQHMKLTCKKTTYRKFRTISVVCAVMLLCSSLTVMSSCAAVDVSGMLDTDTDSHEANLQEKEMIYRYDALDNALHNHFMVSADAAITEAQYASLETLDIYFIDCSFSSTVSDLTLSYVIPLFSFNGDPLEQAMPNILPKAYLTDSILPAVGTTFPSDTDETSGAVKKIEAFYRTIDPADPSLTEEEVQTIIAMYPESAVQPTAYFDPYATWREDCFLSCYLIESKLGDTACMTADALQKKIEENEFLRSITVTIHEEPLYRYENSHGSPSAEPEILNNHRGTAYQERYGASLYQKDSDT